MCIKLIQINCLSFSTIECGSGPRKIYLEIGIYILHSTNMKASQCLIFFLSGSLTWIKKELLKYIYFSAFLSITQINIDVHLGAKDQRHTLYISRFQIL